jgi:hypothetical protein
MGRKLERTRLASAGGKERLAFLSQKVLPSLNTVLTDEINFEERRVTQRGTGLFIKYEI